MKTTTKIDSAGRLVIPKPLRQKYGLTEGQRVRLIPVADGLTIVPEHPERRFVKRGPVLAIDTGAPTPPLEAFDLDGMRAEHLEDKSIADRDR